jgi:hypothetical protein
MTHVAYHADLLVCKAKETVPEPVDHAAVQVEESRNIVCSKQILSESYCWALFYVLHTCPDDSLEDESTGDTGYETH